MQLAAAGEDDDGERDEDGDDGDDGDVGPAV